MIQKIKKGFNVTFALENHKMSLDCFETSNIDISDQLSYALDNE